jgi:hypothetical protein
MGVIFQQDILRQSYHQGEGFTDLFVYLKILDNTKMLLYVAKTIKATSTGVVLVFLPLPTYRGNAFTNGAWITPATSVVTILETYKSPAWCGKGPFGP